MSPSSINAEHIHHHLSSTNMPMLGGHIGITLQTCFSEERCGVQAVKVRGESMAAAAKLGKPHGMLSIIGLEDK